MALNSIGHAHKTLLLTTQLEAQRVSKTEIWNCPQQQPPHGITAGTYLLTEISKGKDFQNLSQLCDYSDIQMKVTAVSDVNTKSSGSRMYESKSVSQ